MAEVPAFDELYVARRQFTRQLMHYFRIGSRRTRYKILRFAGCQINPTSVLAAEPVADQY